ncbi:hypothetical protein GCM10010326_75120 [Streptomyces xanthochromogenes]|uniref:Uncharacterized protein n=1 Tax=Streptomyces xanthochromogenes TaxID=67384 RepID=A0ABQ3B049_9ACTN|nr:hypothetical protein GCM10010326_75120 [Streptomyces xanthochromogenes]
MPEFNPKKFPARCGEVLTEMRSQQFEWVEGHLTPGNGFATSLALPSRSCVLGAPDPSSALRGAGSGRPCAARPG